jgi:tRNA(Ile)-lysidine synthase
MQFHRPLLEVPGAAAIRHWLTRAGIAFVEDPTNADTALTRNRIRARLLPALEQAFPQFRETFARSARHAAQAQQVLDAWRRRPAAVGRPARDCRLQAAARARQANLLRHWLRTVHAAAASAAQLDELLDQIAACTHSRPPDPEHQGRDRALCGDRGHLCLVQWARRRSSPAG